MITFLRKYEVWCLLGLIILINAIFVTCIVWDILPKRLYNFGRFLLLGVVLFGGVFLARGWDGVKGLVTPMLKWRRSPLWYLGALFVNAVICGLFLAVKGAVLGTGVFDIGVTFDLVRRPHVLLTVGIGSFIGEIVWISYAVTRLSKQVTSFEAALIVGAVWTAWWMPMVIYNFGVIPNLPFGALLINQTGIALICTLVYIRSQSGLVVLCMQMMFNLTVLAFPVTPLAGGVGTYWAFAGTYFCAALLMFVIFGPKPMLSLNHQKESPTVI